MYFDRKDATQVIVEGPNGKMYRSTKLKEHYVVVGEPGTYYSHTYPQLMAKGHKLAQEIFEFISETMLCEKLTIIGTYGTTLMTAKFNSAICFLEALLKNPLQ